MSETEKDTSIANIENRDANVNQRENENHSAEENNAKIFNVEKPKFALEIPVPPGKSSDGAAESCGTQSPPSPATTQTSSGYATYEAIPMTVFYRSEHSQGHIAKQRPTLKELRKGFENDKVR